MFGSVCISPSLFQPNRTTLCLLWRWKPLRSARNCLRSHNFNPYLLKDLYISGLPSLRSLCMRKTDRNGLKRIATFVCRFPTPSTCLRFWRLLVVLDLKYLSMFSLTWTDEITPNRMVVDLIKLFVSHFFRGKSKPKPK